MKKTSGNLNNRKHLDIHKLRNSELKAALGGQDEIHCGDLVDECKRLTVVVNARYEVHKVVLQGSASAAA